MVTAHSDSMSCPICGSVTTSDLCSVDGYLILRCATCATDFVHPLPNESALKQYYDRGAWFEGGERGGYKNYDEQTNPLLSGFAAMLDSFGERGEGLSVLDVGCGYGSHLALAQKRGWRCFGIEVSAHARKVAEERHGRSMFVVDSAENLIPHEFDLVVMFDVIEHLSEPYALFYTLFSKGAIAPKTKVIITTPNARSTEAVADPSSWAYRHPPSHLVFYSAQSLDRILRRLRFKSVSVNGQSKQEELNEINSYPDENFPLNDGLRRFSGLICEASGSDFAEFAHERYVPGTWSRLAEYEHLPRYLYARNLAAGRRVLDFGCGTGYGTAVLSQTATSVIGVDIDANAIAWARDSHPPKNLSFEQRDDLGAGLSPRSYDLITCFEMIEHVPQEVQMATIKNLARLVADDGTVVISTPNPEITALYGHNPYHMREMNEEEFSELLSAHFPHVRMFYQWVQPSVLISPGWKDSARLSVRELAWNERGLSARHAAVFVALCSKHPVPETEGCCYVDFRTDYVAEEINRTNLLNQTRLDQYTERELAASLGFQLTNTKADIDRYHARTQDLESQLTDTKADIDRYHARIQDLMSEANTLRDTISRIQTSASWRLTAPLRALKAMVSRRCGSSRMNQDPRRGSEDAELNRGAGGVQSVVGKVASQETQIAYQEAQIASLIVERDSILNSKTWKITKPLRVVYPLLVTRPYRQIRHFGLAIVRNVIHFMPIPDRQKDLLRTRLFHYFEVIKGRRQLRTAPPYSAQELLLVESAAGQEPVHLVASPYTAETMAMGSTHRFLLVSHQFSRTGAPRAVLFLARALFQLYGVRPVVISPDDGPMREEFEQEGFPTVVDPQLFSYESYSFAACNFVMGFERVVVTSLASYPFIRYFRDIAKHLSWWIHETEAGFTAVAAMTSDLALLFAASESIWLGSPLCIPFASQYASREKLSLLLYGCEDAALPPRAPENGKVVFSIVGSVEPRKGQDIFLDAIARLPEDIRQKGIFRIIGSPLSYVSQRYCEKVRSGAALFREVECVPDVSPDRLQELYAETMVIVSASRDDPMPIVVTQGFMFSKVCLCSSAIGHAQLFEDGKEGLIFANESVEMLAEKMAWIISNPTESKAMGRAGRSVYEKFFDLNSFVQNVQKATAPDLS